MLVSVIHYWRIYMFKSKKKKFAPWPWRIRGLYVVLGISLLLNAIAISFIVLLNSRQADLAVISHAIRNSCNRDYAWNMTNLPATSEGRVVFSEALCKRDAVTGEYFKTSKVVDGHYVLR